MSFSKKAKKAIMFKTENSSQIHSVGIGINDDGHTIMLVQFVTQELYVYQGQAVIDDFMHIIHAAQRKESVGTLFNRIKKSYTQDRIGDPSGSKLTYFKSFISNNAYIERYADISEFDELKDGFIATIAPEKISLVLRLPSSLTALPWAW